MLIQKPPPLSEGKARQLHPHGADLSCLHCGQTKTLWFTNPDKLGAPVGRNAPLELHVLA